MEKFRNKNFGFEISYPEEWQVMPTPWVKNFMGRAKSTSEKLSEYISKYQSPFLFVHDPELVPGLPVSVIKCNIYNVNAFAQVGGLANGLASSESVLREAFPDLEMKEFVPEYLFAGVVGVKMAMTMSVKNEEGASFHALTEAYYLPTSRYIFAVSLSASFDISKRPVELFENVKRSIRLS